MEARVSIAIPIPPIAPRSRSVPQARTLPGLTTPVAFIYIANVLFPRRPLSETLTRVMPMSPDSRKARRLVGVFLLGWVLLNYPILSLFNLPAAWGGVPLLYAYVFAAWSLIVGLLAVVSRPDRTHHGTDG